MSRCEVPDFIRRDLKWQLRAACLGLYGITGEDLFFPRDNPGGPKAGKGITGERERIEKARAVCATCPVMRECFDYAVKNDCQGFWGGMTEGERRREMRVRRGRAAPSL